MVSFTKCYLNEEQNLKTGPNMIKLMKIKGLTSPEMGILEGMITIIYTPYSPTG